jgi:uncharacterized protein YbjT (DUF2867 family)
MKAILFGATGMVGQGVLRECLRSNEVESVLAVGRRTSGVRHPKLSQITHQDFSDFWDLEPQLAGYDACFYCQGVSSLGMKASEYLRVTYDFALAAAQSLARQNPDMTFIYVSGAGTDSSEMGPVAWARVKGATENAIFRLPFRAAYAFRPAYIQPLHGITPKTRWLRLFYATAAPLYPLWKKLLPQYVTTTEAVGRAMIETAARGARKQVLENRDINEMAARMA